MHSICWSSSIATSRASSTASPRRRARASAPPSPRAWCAPSRRTRAWRSAASTRPSAPASGTAAVSTRSSSTTRLLRFAAVNLHRTRATDLRFEARLEMLRELALRHAEAEEDWAFPKAKRNLCDEDLDRIGVEVEHAHDMLMAHARSPASAWDRSPRRGASAFAGSSRRRADPAALADLVLPARLERIDVSARPLPVRRAHRETARPTPRASQRRAARQPS